MARTRAAAGALNQRDTWGQKKADVSRRQKAIVEIEQPSMLGSSICHGQLRRRWRRRGPAAHSGGRRGGWLQCVV